jgi:tRNA(fMet)-specific endonuclease VapC
LKIEKITSLLNVYPFDETAAKHYAVIRAQLESKGVMISERDTQIAAIASANRLTVVTRNVKEFLRIEKLGVEDWATG